MTGRAASPADAVRIPGQWAERALCAHADPDACHPEHHALIAKAKPICDACRVRTERPEHALSGADT